MQQKPIFQINVDSENNLKNANTFVMQIRLDTTTVQYFTLVVIHESLTNVVEINLHTKDWEKVTRYAGNDNGYI